MASPSTARRFIRSFSLRSLSRRRSLAIAGPKDIPMDLEKTYDTKTGKGMPHL
ncbi:hypothetical protein LguiA_014725 [Lonicera macranthoides]